MANQVIVTNTGNVQVAIEPTPNVQVQISRAAIGTVSNVPSANFANYAANVTSSNQPNITSLGTLSNLSVSGNTTLNNLVVTGNLSVGNLFANNANYANYANVANTANSVAVANVVGIGNIAITNYDGNGSNILHGNGYWGPEIGPQSVANANYANFAGTAYSVSGSNVSGEVANANFATYSSQANTANLATYATTANSVAGANVSGDVSGANHANIADVANSVAVGNVVGIGNIATINLDGNASNILYGNGVFGPDTGPQDVANANYANFAGTAYSVSGSNVSGEVANANYATYAGTAYSVAGSNVSGEVANANFASYANVSNVANSVAVGNVSGIGNIATINLDGNASNALLGNGSWGPVEVTSTTIANGTSNINIPVANGNIQFSVNNNANLVGIETGGILINAAPLLSQNNGLRITSVGRGGSAAGASRIYWAKQRGTIASPLSVEPNDYTAEILTTAHNGISQQTNSTALIRAQVDSSYVANGANIPLGWNIQVNDTNGGINNQSKIHNFYSNGNVSFANAIFGNSLSVTGNVTGANANLGNLATANYFSGDGSLLSNITAGNITGTVANATYAITAGTASAIGNIANLNIVSSNTSLPTDQFNTSGIVVGSTANANLQANSLQVVVDYGNGQGDSNSALTKGIAYVKARGTSASPTTAVANDIIKRENYLAYNGTSNVLYASAGANATTINANANAVWGSGTYTINTGSVNGDLGNANALSAYNSFNFLSSGQLQIIAGSNSAAGSLINLISYGQPTSVAQGQGITFSKARGNRDGSLSVQANDTLGRLVFQGHNGTALVTNRLPIIRSQVDSSYVANTANIPAGINMVVCDSNTNYQHNFYANGAVTLAGNLSASGGNYYFSNTAGGSLNYGVAGDKTTNSTYGLDNIQFSVTLSNVDTSTGFSPFRFQQYAPTSNQFGAMYYYRARGNDYFSQAPVVAGDQVMSYNFLVNSNNVTTSIGSFNSTVAYNDNAGNVGTTLDFNAIGSGTTGYLNGSINLLANTTTANNFTAANVTASQFMKFPTYTASALTAITGSVGWMAAVVDSGGGGNPNGMMAFWDTSNNRWSYVHDNSAV